MLTHPHTFFAFKKIFLLSNKKAEGWNEYFVFTFTQLHVQ